MEPTVYILECRDGAYYVGSTTNLERRIAEHHAGVGSNWVSSRRPVQVVYSQMFPSLREAFEAERQLKGWRREKKEALIRGEWDNLPELADTRLRVVLRGPQDDI
ncbi:MAG: GIY-YIG nuclease family protein [Chloroflexi bacterium]|jgi:putative endonuclease|nr:GIY-YIG nuclease family protein [Chloroflexota bacterium]MBT5628164.1 GIY-YIG nuclease family protein [Chloroflexota bacterium]